MNSLPFDEKKYNELMDRLEAVEVNRNLLERTFRVDSEFYSKENLNIEKKLQKFNCENLTQLAKISDGNHMSISESFIEKGIPYYRGQDIHNFFIEDSTPICIDRETFMSSTIKRSHLKKGDVLLSIVGTIGGVSLVGSEADATCNCKLAILRPEKIDGYFLATFLKSKYGQVQIKKFTRGAVQMGLILEDMSQIKIPEFSLFFQKNIRDIIHFSKESSTKSQLLYSEAENILLSELGLKDFDFSTNPISVKTFKESFLSSGRIDAEYYQEKYDEIEAKIKKYKNGFLALEDFIENYSTGFPFSSETYLENGEGVFLIRINNITPKGLSLENAAKIPEKDIELSKKDIIKKGDILISMSGSIGLSCSIEEEIVGVINQRIFRITPKKFDGKVLSMLINSALGKMQLDRIGTGGVQVNISTNDIKKILIPNIRAEVQKEISDKIQESFSLRKQSAELLEIAKRGVEMAIEVGEEKAMSWMEIKN
ncbi:MAG: restriction endonuclease subunit S [Fusobacteriaceae bacterium]